MKKKMLLIIFAIFINFILINRGFAITEFTCEYTHIRDGATQILTVNINGDEVTSKFKLGGKNYNSILDFEIYYDGECPEYLGISWDNGVPILGGYYNNLEFVTSDFYYNVSEETNRLECLYHIKDSEQEEPIYLIAEEKNQNIKTSFSINSKYYENIKIIDDESLFTSPISPYSSCPEFFGYKIQDNIPIFQYLSFKKVSKDKKEDLGPSLCTKYVKEETCKTSVNSGNVSCVWNKKNVSGVNYEYCNVDKLLYVACGDTRDIPIEVPAFISFVINFLKILTPLILIFVSIISLVKALAAQKEDEIKKAQSSLIKKIISAVMVFFVISIVQFVISKVADIEIKDENGNTEKDHLSDCLACFLNNDCEDSAYYKINTGGEDYCTTLKSGESSECKTE